MSNLRQAAQQALEALENDAMQRTYAGGVRITNAAIALRKALAEPEWAVMAHVSGVKDGEMMIKPLNRALCLPVGTALCAHIQTVKKARLS